MHGIYDDEGQNRRVRDSFIRFSSCLYPPHPNSDHLFRSIHTHPHSDRLPIDPVTALLHGLFPIAAWHCGETGCKPSRFSTGRAAVTPGRVRPDLPFLSAGNTRLLSSKGNIGLAPRTDASYIPISPHRVYRDCGRGRKNSEFHIRVLRSPVNILDRDSFLIFNSSNSVPLTS